MDSKDALKRIVEITEQVNELLDEATELADEHDVSFKFSPRCTSETFTYVPAVVWEGSSSCEWDDSGYTEDGYWDTEWASSSADC